MSFVRESGLGAPLPSAGEARPRVATVLIYSLKILSIFTLVGILWALDFYIFYQKEGVPLRPFAYFLTGTLPMAYSWAMITPVILWACRRWWFERGQRWRVAYYHLLLLVVLAPIRSLLDIGLTKIALLLHYDRQLDQLYSNDMVSFLSGLPLAPVFYALIAGVGYTFTYYRKYREKELAASNLERALAQAHLESLRSQLNPHFLFNTLHAIGTLARKDPEGTKRMVTLLGGLLRRSLGSSAEPQEVPLRHEIDYVQKYLEIEQILFSDRLAVDYDIPAELLDCLVPNFVLQPILENAIQQGIASRSGPGSIVLRARAEDGSLEVSVVDDGIGPAEGSDLAEGEGLSLTKERLQGLYGERASLRVENREGGGAVAVLRLPLSAAPRSWSLEEEP